LCAKLFSDTIPSIRGQAIPTAFRRFRAVQTVNSLISRIANLIIKKLLTEFKFDKIIDKTGVYLKYMSKYLRHLHKKLNFTGRRTDGIYSSQIRMKEGRKIKLTETQKNFRREMEEIEKSNPDNKRYRLKTILDHIFKASVWLIIGYAAFTFLWDKISTKDMANNEPQIMPSIQATLDNNLSGSALSERAMPERIARDIQSLELYSDQLLIVREQISSFHKQTWDERDLQQYKAALINGVETADQYLEHLKGLKVDADLQNIWFAKYERIKNVKAAYGYYLDYLHSKRSSDIEMGNHFLTLANSAEDIQLLIEYFEQNGYRYALDQNGGVRYWYSKSGF